MTTNNLSLWFYFCGKCGAEFWLMIGGGGRKKENKKEMKSIISFLFI